MAELNAKGVCDFCGEACNADMRGAKAYDCADFPMPMGGTSDGAWAACPACATLIDDGKWDDLEERMTELCRRRFGFLAELMLPKLRMVHAQQVRLFRQHRKPLHRDEEFSEPDMTSTFGKGKSETMRITTFWLGTKVLDDGNLSDLMEDAYLAFQHADWMTVADDEGFPRATKPGDTFWCPFPVDGVELLLHDGCLVANDGTAELRLEQVDLFSVLPAADPLVTSLIGMLNPPPEEPEADTPTGRFDAGLSGSFGQGGTN